MLEQKTYNENKLLLIIKKVTNIVGTPIINNNNNNNNNNNKGYRKWGTHAQVYYQTLEYGNSNNEIK